ncbi:MAG TPA: Flp pilus assembly protein CpaB [Acidimicrobiia bacterium]
MTAADEGKDHVRNWRVLTAAVAAVAAVLAAVGVYFYLNKADQRAQSKVAQVPVLVASQPIPAGTSGATALQRGWLTTKKVARDAVPNGTLTTSSGLNNLVAAYAIDDGGYITPGSFVQSAQQNDTSTAIDKGYEAMALSVDDQSGVAGFVSPGDRVNMIASVRIGQKMVTAYLIPGLKVLGVGATTVTTNAQPAAAVPSGDNTTPTTQAQTGNKGLITVEVTSHEAVQIAQAYALNSIVYLTLDPTHFDTKAFKTPTEIVETTNLFDQALTELNKSGK